MKSNLDLNGPIERDIYHKLDEKFHRTFTIMHFALVKITTIGTTTPIMIMSYAKFYVIDSNAEDSFELPSPMM